MIRESWESWLACGNFCGCGGGTEEQTQRSIASLSGQEGTNWLLVEGGPQTGYDKIVTAN